MTTPKVYQATIICTPAYRDWLRARYRFNIVPGRAVIANVEMWRCSAYPRPAAVVRFRYAQ